MKKLLLILSLVLFTGDFYGQKEITVYIEPALVSLVYEYAAEASERGIDVYPHINQMSLIIFSNLLSYPILGIASNDGKIVAISPYCSLDKTILRTVLFHELTHSIFKESHKDRSEFDIMKSHSPISFRVYDNDSFWESRLDELFSGKNSVLK